MFFVWLLAGCTPPLGRRTHRPIDRTDQRPSVSYTHVPTQSTGQSHVHPSIDRVVNMSSSEVFMRCHDGAAWVCQVVVLCTPAKPSPPFPSPSCTRNSKHRASPPAGSRRVRASVYVRVVSSILVDLPRRCSCRPTDRTPYDTHTESKSHAGRIYYFNTGILHTPTRRGVDLSPMTHTALTHAPETHSFNVPRQRRANPAGRSPRRPPAAPAGGLRRSVC